MDFSGIYCTEMQKILLPLGLAPSFAHRVVHAVWVRFLARGAQSFSYHQMDFCLQDPHNFNSFCQQSLQLGGFLILLEQGSSAILSQST